MTVSNSVFRAGLIGLGGMGKIHDRVLAGIDDIDVIAIFDPEPVDDPRAVADAAAILNHPDINVVYIATPNHLTVDYGIAALERGKHIFCEKPLGCSGSDAARLVAASLKAPECVVKVGLNHRYMVHYREAKRLIQSGKYGRILWIRGRYGKGSDELYPKSWRAKKDQAGGGILIDQGIHMIDLALDILNEPIIEKKSFLSSRRWPEIDTEDNAFVLLRSESGVTVSVHSSITQYNHIFSLEIGLEYGLVEVNGVLSSTKSYGKERLIIHHSWKDNFCHENTFTYRSNDYYTIRNESIDFIDVIRTGRREFDGNLAQAVRLMEIIDEIYSADDIFQQY